ncbi:Rho GDP-dissociation inhibitor [Penicillium chermesinum]|uniref:Rho GDP-dissociation inhibitor n=1 Tax=Penicillium chermesinum TaxID=63820 RepID=A0A9W9PI10_9EURO|nr:Rho GDP-dissociation inhibitor [Penicillium chermesinum]KAJ5246296.1 Rho GDP-dissociation inhibitor [Penicillium chermesinum]KAJ6144584.1 Rho GDP-dissociation inhibitor [Penicillium chermesinum]
MADHDDLAATRTEGFKVGEKKKLDEYNKLDADDEAMVRWKASLGLNQGEPIGKPGDPNCVIKSLSLVVDGRPDVTIDLSSAGAVETLKDKPFTIKEGAKFHIKVLFQVNNEILSGLKYLQVVKRKGIRVSKDEEMLGSFAPNTTQKPIYEKEFNEEEAPSGMLARGHYNAVSRFLDDDDHDHLIFEWSFDIAKDW